MESERERAFDICFGQTFEYGLWFLREKPLKNTLLQFRGGPLFAFLMSGNN